jgi:hypothetical protein
VSHPRKWTRALAVLACLLPGPTSAEWRALTGRALEAALISHDVQYGDVAWERHEADGMLLLRSTEGDWGRTSLGVWMLRGDARCLRWNRAMDWECYRVETDGAEGIRFIDGYGNVSEGRLSPRRE